MVRRIALLTVGLALVGFTPVQDGYTLQRTAKVNDAFKYKLNVKATISGVDGLLTGTSEEKVLKVGEDGTIEIQQNWKDSKVEFGGSEQPGPEFNVVYVYGKRGELKGVKGENIDDAAKVSFAQLDNLRQLVIPETAVKIGDTWTVEVKPEALNGNIGSKVEFKLESTEKLGEREALVVKMVSKQTAPGAATSEMKLWVDKTSGWLLKADGAILKLPFPNLPIPIDAHFTYTRSDVAGPGAQ